MDYALNGLNIFFTKKHPDKKGSNNHGPLYASPKNKQKINHCDLIFAKLKDQESKLHSTDDVCVLTFKSYKVA